MKKTDPNILPVDGSELKIPYSLSVNNKFFLIIVDDEETTPLSPLIIIDKATNIKNIISLNTLDNDNFSFLGSIVINVSSYRKYSIN